MEGLFYQASKSKGALCLPARRFSEPPRADGSGDDARRACLFAETHRSSKEFLLAASRFLDYPDYR